MATVSKMIDDVCAATGHPAEDGRQRGRRLREADLLPQHGRGRGAAHVEEIHCARALISFMAPCTIARTAKVVADIAALTWEREEARTFVPTPTGTVQTYIVRAHRGLELPPSDLRALPLEGVLAWLIHQCCSPQGRQMVLSNLDSVSIWQDGTTALVSLRDGAAHWYRPADDPNAVGYNWNRPAPLRTMTTVPATIFPILADLVLDTERTVGRSLPFDGPSGPEGGSNNGPDVPASEPSIDEGGAGSLSRATDAEAVVLPTSRQPVTSDFAKQETESGMAKGSPRRVKPSVGRKRTSDAGKPYQSRPSAT